MKQVRTFEESVKENKENLKRWVNDEFTSFTMLHYLTIGAYGLTAKEMNQLIIDRKLSYLPASEFVVKKYGGYDSFREFIRSGGLD